MRFLDKMPVLAQLALVNFSILPLVVSACAWSASAAESITPPLDY